VRVRARVSSVVARCTVRRTARACRVSVRWQQSRLAPPIPPLLSQPPAQHCCGSCSRKERASASASGVLISIARSLPTRPRSTACCSSHVSRVTSTPGASAGGGSASGGGSGAAAAAAVTGLLRREAAAPRAAGAHGGRRDPHPGLLSGVGAAERGGEAVVPPEREDCESEAEPEPPPQLSLSVSPALLPPPNDSEDTVRRRRRGGGSGGLGGSGSAGLGERRCGGIIPQDPTGGGAATALLLLPPHAPPVTTRISAARWRKERMQLRVAGQSRREGSVSACFAAVGTSFLAAWGCAAVRRRRWDRAAAAAAQK
jgi:hypothetical protein